MSSVDRLRFVSVTSLGRSGSTLLSILLGTHPEIATVSEMVGPIDSVDVDEYHCSCGQLMRDCQFWSEVSTKMRDRGYDFAVDNFGTRMHISENPLARRFQFTDLRFTPLDSIRDELLYTLPYSRRRLAEVVERNVALARVILEICGKPVFLDVSKAHHRVRYLRRFSDVDLKVIHLLRDPRGYVHSVRKGNSGESVSIGTAARHWVRYNAQMERTLASLRPDQRLTVRYEDTCRDPLGTLQEISDYCGVTVPKELPALKPAEQHILGNRMRLRESLEIRQDFAWRDALSQRQIRLIERIAGSYATTQGYKLGNALPVSAEG